MNNWGRLGVFDLETTGVDVETARIVSACVAVIEPEGQVVSRWDWLADPGVEIPEGASAVHGITTERARREGRPARDVVAEITQALRVLLGLGIPLVVYNAPYDLSLLDRECRRYGFAPLASPSPVIDPLVLDRKVDRFRKGKRTLEATAELYEVSLDGAHDAGADAIAAGRVAQALARAYADELDIPLSDLHGRQEIWYVEQAASFSEYIRRVKGDADFVADSAWPVRPSEHPTALFDTQPIPAPSPRPSRTVPRLDFATGTLALEPEFTPALAPTPTLTLTLTPTLTPAEVTEIDPNDPGAEPEATQPHNPQPHNPQPENAQPENAQPDDDGRSAGSPQSLTVLRVAAAIITDSAGRTLLVRKRGSSSFMQAGGKIEAGESALDALSRELDEELGFQIDLDATEHLGSFRAVAANEPDTVIRAEVFAVAVSPELLASGGLTAADEIEELLWIDSGEPGVELAPLTRDTLLPLWLSRRSAPF